jgi:hypothetical protein
MEQVLRRVGDQKIVTGPINSLWNDSLINKTVKNLSSGDLAPEGVKMVLLKYLLV